MNHKLLTIVLVLLAAFGLTVAVSAQDDMSSNSPVQSFVDGAVLDGSWSIVNRYDNGLSMSLHTSDLVPGDAYTVWWVVFNEPQNCTDGVCNEDDLFFIDADTNSIVVDDFGQRQMNPAALENARISVQYATGGVVDADGNGDFAAAVGTGNVPGVIAGPGVVNPQTAEVHLVIRTHGPVVADLFDAQITSFGGGCEPADAAPCADVQFSMHQPA